MALTKCFSLLLFKSVRCISISNLIAAMSERLASTPPLRALQRFSAETPGNRGAPELDAFSPQPHKPRTQEEQSPEDSAVVMRLDLASGGSPLNDTTAAAQWLRTAPSPAAKEEDEEDALEDELAADQDAAQHGAHAVVSADGPGTLQGHFTPRPWSWSIGLTMVAGCLGLACLVAVVFAASAVYVNVVYHALGESIKEQAAECSVNGTVSSAFGNDAEARAQWYGAVRGQALLNAIGSALEAIVLQPLTDVADVMWKSLEQVPARGSWPDATSFAYDVMANATLLADVAATTFIGRPSRTCHVVLAAVQFASQAAGGLDTALLRIGTDGCTSMLSCVVVTWHLLSNSSWSLKFRLNSSGRAVVSDHGSLPLPCASTSLVGNDTEWSLQWLSAVGLPSSAGSPTCRVVLVDGTVAPTFHATGANGIGLAATLPPTRHQQSALFHVGMPTSVPPPFDATDVAIEKELVATLDSIRLGGSSGVALWARDASNVSNVVTGSYADTPLFAAYSIDVSSSSTAFTTLPSGVVGLLWVDALKLTRQAYVSAASSPLPWNTTSLQIILTMTQSALIADMNRYSERISRSVGDGQLWLGVATVAVGVVFVVALGLYVRRLLATADEVSEEVAAVLQSLRYAKTMELEKATLFVPSSDCSGVLQSVSPSSNVLPLQSSRAIGDAGNQVAEPPRQRDQDAASPGQLSLSPPRQKKPNQPVRIFSKVREIQAAQAAVNRMMASLREYRKFLPSTLFVHGELPLHDELAEELLQAIESPASASPRMSTAANTKVPGGDVTPPAAALAPAGSSDFFAAKEDSKGNVKPTALSRPASPHLSSRANTGKDLFGETSVGAFGQQSSITVGPASPHDHNSMALKRRKATILTITFAGFLRISQESIFEAHNVSQTFLQIVLSVIDRNDGVVLLLSPDKVVATWNCFKTDHMHEHHGAQCAHELNRTLHAADEEFLFSDHQIAIAVTSGNVAAGASGTATERASVVEGRCVDLSNDLLSLLIAINVRCVVTGGVADQVSAPLWTIPIDIITDEDSTTHVVHELRSGDEPPYVAVMRKAFTAFAENNYILAKELYADAVKQSVARGIDPASLRLLKLSTMFSKLHTPYIRMTPCWQRFETDMPKTAMSPDTASPKRRYRSEKRPSYLAEEQLRMELMSLRYQSTAAASPVRTRDGHLDDGLSAGGASAQRTPRSPVPSRPDSPHMHQSLNVHYGERRPSQERRASQERRPSQERRLSGTPLAPLRRRSTPKVSALEEQIARMGGSVLGPVAMGSVAPQASVTHAVEFHDKRDMVFRMSDHVLGKGANGEVLMGMSETGSLCAIKSVQLPSFAPQTQAPMNEVQRRRLKRKGINVVTDDIEKDIDALLNEVSLLSRLRHENIVGYLSSAIVDKKILVVMEYISGGSLLNMLKEFRGVPLATARRYLRDVLRGLQYLHSEDIVHRDIKPQNVLLLIDGSCKLTDFGTCQRMSKLTGVATMEGTPQYMAPEAANGKAEKASDVWSFGILMAQLLTGELPWPNDTNFVAMGFTYRLGHDESMVPTIPESVSSDAREVIRSCCHRDPAMRPTVTQLLSNPFFTVTAPTPLKSTLKKRLDRSMQRGQSVASKNPNSPNTSAGTTKRFSSTLLQYSAFAEPATGSVTPEIPGLVVQGPEDESSSQF